MKNQKKMAETKKLNSPKK